MRIPDVNKGIDYCLNNANRLLNDADLLFRNRGYHSSVPLCVFAYEEIGKAQFLQSCLLDKGQVDEREFAAFTNGRGAHMKKLTVDYDDIMGTLETMSEEQFESVKKWAKANGKQSWNCDRKTAIEIVKTDTATIDRLHDLKMAFLYTDYGLGEWISTINYPNSILAAIDQYIYWEVTRAYYKVKLNVYLFSIGVNKRHQPMTPNQQLAMLTNEDCVTLNAIFENMSTDRFRRAKSVAVREIPEITKKVEAVAIARRL